MSVPAKKIEKFGTQAVKAKVIYVFPNGDKHHKGVKITIKPTRTFEQLLQEFNTSVGVATGAVRQVFTAEGKSVKKVDEFEDGAKYVCAGAEKFAKDLLSPALLGEEPEAKEVVKSPPTKTAPKKPTVSAYSKGEGVTKFGTQTEKAKVIYVFRNADKHHKGVKITVHSTKFKTFDQLKEQLTKEVKLPTGAVMKLYTPDGKSVKDLSGLEDEAKYIATSAEKLNLELMPTAINETEEDKEKEKEEVQEKPKEVAPKKPTVSAYAKGEGLKKFGMQTEKAKVIYVFRNADKHHKGVKITVHPTKFKTFDQLKEALTKEVGVTTGAVMKLYTPTGGLVKDLKDVIDGEKYVCAGPEKFNEELIPTAINDDPENIPQPEKPSAPVKTTPKKPTVSAYAKGEGLKKFGTQTEKARNIYVFRNADKHDKGVKITLKFKTFDQLKEAMTKQCKVVTGAVRQVFTKDGKLVKSLEEIEDEQRYVCAGAEKFNAALLPLAILKEDNPTSVKKTPLKKSASKSKSSSSVSEDLKESKEEEENGEAVETPQEEKKEDNNENSEEPSNENSTENSNEGENAEAQSEETKESTEGAEN